MTSETTAWYAASMSRLVWKAFGPVLVCPLNGNLRAGARGGLVVLAERVGAGALQPPRSCSNKCLGAGAGNSLLCRMAVSE